MQDGRTRRSQPLIQVSCQAKTDNFESGKSVRYFDKIVYSPAKVRYSATSFMTTRGCHCHGQTASGQSPPQQASGQGRGGAGGGYNPPRQGCGASICCGWSQETATPPRTSRIPVHHASIAAPRFRTATRDTGRGAVTSAIDSNALVRYQFYRPAHSPRGDQRTEIRILGGPAGRRSGGQPLDPGRVRLVACP